MPASSKSNTRGKSAIAGIRSRTLLDSRRLFYFFHVARLGSVSAAEAVLDIAQSALTRQIQQLEAEVGEQLMQRTGRGMELTPAGKILFEHAETILQDMATTLKLIEHSRGDPAGGQLRIASPPTFSKTVMPEVVRRFLASSPDVRLTVQEASTDQVYELIASGEADLAIVMHEPTSRKLVLQKLATEQLMLMMGPQHPWAAHKSVAREELSQLELTTGLAIHGSRAAVETYCNDAGVQLDVKLRLDSLAITKAVLRENRYCSVMSRTAFHREIEAGEVVALPLVPQLRRTVFVARLRERPYTEQMRTLVAEIFSVAKAHYGE